MPGLDGVQLHLVDNMAAVAEFRRWLGERHLGTVCYDTESAGLNPHRDAWRLIQVGDMVHGWAFPSQLWGGPALEALSSYGGELGVFNGPYDNRVLQVHAGWQPRWEATHDGLLGAHIADSVRVAALKPRAAIEIDPRAMAGEQILSDGMRKQGWSWGTVPVGWAPYWQYAALDPVLTSHLIEKFRPDITGRFRAAYDLERATARLCTQMMMTGMMIDRPFIHERLTELAAYIEQAKPWLRHQFGIGSVNSGEQVGEALNRVGIPTLVRTDSGKASIAKDTLRLYSHMFPQHRELLDAIRICRKAESLTGYLNGFLDLAGPDDIVHYSIHSCRARTTRMSVTDPAMQTFDRDQPMVRGSFVPRPGFVFLSIDADQIEARLAAHVSGDEHMIATFLEADRLGQKFFILMAGQIYGDKITKEDPRYTWTKNATYAQIYGSGLDQAARTAGVPVEQMRPVYAGFRQLYPMVGARMDWLIRNGKENGRPAVNTLYGHRLFADRGHAYALLNYEIQGSAAEIMKMGQLEVAAAGYGDFLRLDIHDEILMEVPEASAQEILRDVSEILTNRTDFRVPITWSGNILRERWRKA